GRGARTSLGTGMRCLRAAGIGDQGKSPKISSGDGVAFIRSCLPSHLAGEEAVELLEGVAQKPRRPTGEADHKSPAASWYLSGLRTNVSAKSASAVSSL